MPRIHYDTLFLLFDILRPHPQLPNQAGLLLPLRLYDCHIPLLQLLLFIR